MKEFVSTINLNFSLQNKILTNGWTFLILYVFKTIRSLKVIQEQGGKNIKNSLTSLHWPESVNFFQKKATKKWNSNQLSINLHKFNFFTLHCAPVWKVCDLILMKEKWTIYGPNNWINLARQCFRKQLCAVLAFHNDLKTILNVHSYFNSLSFSP